MKDIKDFVWECMLFQNPKEGSVIPNWQLGVYGWINVSIIILGIYSLIQKH